MATHLGRLKIVTKRKAGICRYKKCPVKDKIIRKGTKTLILTKQGNIKGRLTIFYKTYHPKCFGPWAMWMVSQAPISKDGRKVMGLDPKAKTIRAKLVRDRARILRALRTATAENLESKVERIAKIDRLIVDTGFPVIPYKGRRSRAIIGFEKFIIGIKEQYKSEMRVPKKVFDQAVEMGMEKEFRGEMENWRQDEQDDTKTHKVHYEDQQEDKEENNG